MMAIHDAVWALDCADVDMVVEPHDFASCGSILMGYGVDGFIVAPELVVVDCVVGVVGVGLVGGMVSCFGLIWLVVDLLLLLGLALLIWLLDPRCGGEAAFFHAEGLRKQLHVTWVCFVLET